MTADIVQYGGITLRTPTRWGMVDAAHVVPIHAVLGSKQVPAPKPLRDGLVTDLYARLDPVGIDRAKALRMKDAPTSDVTLYTCPLAPVSDGCPSPQHSPALNAALDALRYARAGLPWGPQRHETTDAVRNMALTLNAAQNAAEAWKMDHEGERGQW